MAAWGLFEKRDVQSLSRVASARTMDGYKIRAKLALNFPRAMVAAEAEEVMMQYARAFATVVECELSNGDLPFEERELLDRITDRVNALPKKNVHLIGLHVWHKGAVSSGSMLAVKPDGRHSSPTVPAMKAARAEPGARVNSEQAPASVHAAMTVKPPVTSDLGPGSNVTETRAPERATSPQTPTMPARPRPPVTPSPGSAGPLSSGMRPGTPAIRTAPASSRSVSPGPATPGPATPAPASSPSLGGMPAAARMASGVVPAVEPRIVRTKSGFLLALEQCAGSTGEEVGRAMAQPVRDAAAGVLLATLDAMHAAVSDPLGLLDGRAAPELRQSLIGEACVCVSYLLYEALTRTRLPQMLSIEVVQGACMQALKDKAMPVSEISRYLATENPREEFSGRVAGLLGVRESSELAQRVEAALRALRIDARACAEQIEQRLSRSGQKTG